MPKQTKEVNEWKVGDAVIYTRGADWPDMPGGRIESINPSGLIRVGFSYWDPRQHKRWSTTRHVEAHQLVRDGTIGSPTRCTLCDALASECECTPTPEQAVRRMIAEQTGGDVKESMDALVLRAVESGAPGTIASELTRFARLADEQRDPRVADAFEDAARAIMDLARQRDGDMALARVTEGRAA